MAGLPEPRAVKGCDCEAKSPASPPRVDAKAALVVEAGVVEQMGQASSSALGERRRIRELSKRLARKQGVEYVWGESCSFLPWNLVSKFL